MAPTFLSRLKIKLKNRGSKTSGEPQTKDSRALNDAAAAAATPSTSTIAPLTGKIELSASVQPVSSTAQPASAPQQATLTASPSPLPATSGQPTLPEIYPSRRLQKQQETKAGPSLRICADNALVMVDERSSGNDKKLPSREPKKATSISNISNKELFDVNEQCWATDNQIYKTLCDGQFRVFRLLPGKFHDPISGSLKVVSLEHHPEYVAMSYVWGEDSASESLSIDGKQLVLTRNLEVALRHLRNTMFSIGELWIDAICINQADVQERAEQVKIMGRIYNLSATVWIWLGPGTKKTDDAMHEINLGHEGDWDSYQFQLKFLEVICRPWFTRAWVVQEFILCKSQPVVFCGHKSVGWSKFQGAWITFEENANHFYSARLEAAIRALRETFEPGWTMTRIESPERLRQTTETEIILKLAELGDIRKMILEQLGFGDMSGLLKDIREYPSPWSERLGIVIYHIDESPEAVALQERLKLFNRNYIGYAEFLQTSRSKWLESGERMTVKQILPEVMHLRCTDPRDKIYSILGLVAEDIARQFPVDYTATYEQVFTQSMAHMIRERLVEPSLQAWLWTKRVENSSLPSWVPDFAASCEWLGPYATHALLGSCGNAAWDLDKDVHVSADNMSLTSQGLYLGEIKELIHCTGYGKEAVLYHLAEIDALSKRESSMEEPLWFTLLDGHHKTNINRRRSIGFFSYIDKEDYGQEFLNLLEFIRSGFHAKLSERDEVLLKRMAIMLSGRTFFVSETGFAGVATPGVTVGDVVAIMPCLVWTPVLRCVKREEREIHTNLPHDINCHYKIVGFAYVGCKDRAIIDPHETYEDRKLHSCFKGKDPTTFTII